MEVKTLKDEMLRRYLLDNLSDEEREGVEEQFFEDDAFFDEMVALEDELYYDYQQNRLTAHERTVFEKKFLQTRRDVEKAAFADAFLRETAELKPEKVALVEKAETVSWWQSLVAFFDFSGSMMQYGMAAAILLLALGVIVLFIQNSRLQNDKTELQNKQAQDAREQERILFEKQLAQAELERELAHEKAQAGQNEKRIQEIEAERARLEKEINEARQRLNRPSPKIVPNQPVTPPQKSVLAFVLLPGLFSRDGGQGMSRIELPPSVKTLRLTLSLDSKDEYKRYDAIIKSVNDRSVVWTGANLKVTGKGAKKNIFLQVPTKNLQRTDYEINLVGITESGTGEEITNYYFSALK